MISVNCRTVKVGHFPAGEQNILDFKHDISDENTIVWKYESDEELVTLVYIVSHIRNYYPKANIYLHMPYIPHARMDRVKSDKEVFTLKYFATVINSLNFNVVYTLDAHSDSSLALIDRIQNDSPNTIISDVMWNIPDADSRHLVVYFPDAGAYKRYKDLTAISNYPKVYGEKIRNWQTHRIEGLNVVTNGTDLKGKSVLLIDDIISYGGTFYHSVLKLKELGADKIYIYASHVENAMIDTERGTLIKLIDDGTVNMLYTTDSIFKSENNEGRNINLIREF
jgi:ribose-phosphate pyrophosphokinase